MTENARTDGYVGNPPSLCESPRRAPACRNLLVNGYVFETFILRASILLWIKEVIRSVAETQYTASEPATKCSRAGKRRIEAVTFRE